LLPHFPRTVCLVVLIPDAPDRRPQLVVAAGPGRPLLPIVGECLLGRPMGPILSRNGPSDKPGTIQSVTIN
jgi:hypothetical protein